MVDADRHRRLRGVDRWNKTLERAGLSYRLRLPSRRFHRHVGIYAGGNRFTPDGDVISAGEWTRRRDEWLPSEADLAYVQSLMHPIYERGQIANWVAAPAKGIHGKSFDFEYVRLD